MSYKADVYVWLKEEVRPSDGHKYYSYILLYVDDVLCIHHDGVNTIKQIDKYFQVKEGLIGDPDMYLGAKLRNIRLPNSVEVWALSPAEYVVEAARNVELYINVNFDGRKLPKRTSAPFPNKYAPELDVSP